MAIVNCPQCAKKISDKQKVCPHCDLDMSELSEEKMQSLGRIKKIKSDQSMMTQQAVAMLMFLGGVLALYNSDAPQSPQHTAAQACMIIGFLWYIINRFRMIIAKRKKRG
ncbi:MAG: hypothetical protein HWE10_11150 [Gammaproteobacteria bacterium]|nr:hypothetical protein [Gammaproteobacteria bacterium]